MKMVRFTVCAALMGGLLCAGWALAQEKQQLTKPSLDRATILRTFVVKNPLGEELGRVRDFLIDVHRGRILYAAVGHGGTLGIGEKYIAVPLHAMRIAMTKDRPNERYFVLDLDKSVIDSDLGFNREDWPITPDAHFLKGAPTPNDKIRARRATALISMPARNLKGEQLGTIRDLMFNVTNEQVIYAALGHGGGVLTAEKLYAVPWDAVTVRTLTGRAADECFVLNVQKAALDAHGGFDNNHWPTEGERSLFNNRNANP
jgi:sporulation protein YlmC with PRC-barrel domain